MTQKYNAHVQHLLGDTVVTELSHEARTRFQRCYGSLAYVCRYYWCEWATIGFASARDLEKHASTHRPQFVCCVSSCDYSRIGFRTANALRQHNANYHVSEAAVHIFGPLRRRRLNHAGHEQTELKDRPVGNAASPQAAMPGTSMGEVDFGASLRPNWTYQTSIQEQEQVQVQAWADTPLQPQLARPDPDPVAQALKTFQNLSPDVKLPLKNAMLHLAKQRAQKAAVRSLQKYAVQYGGQQNIPPQIMRQHNVAVTHMANKIYQQLLVQSVDHDHREAILLAAGVSSASVSPSLRNLLC